jgi:hypothetical protein
MLDEVIFQSSVRELAFRDEDLARVIETYGAPALWVREPGFPSLVYRTGRKASDFRAGI